MKLRYTSEVNIWIDVVSYKIVSPNSYITFLYCEYFLGIIADHRLVVKAGFC
mgnify:CR=1 FL=1